MSRAAACLLLALVWVAITGSPTPLNFLLGALLGILIPALLREQMWPAGEAATPRRRVRPLPALSLAWLFLRELVLSGWRVARLVTQPKMDLKPGIFAFPLTVDRDFEIVLLANLITLTPGTLSVDVSPDRRTLYVHAIDCSDPEAARRDIAQGFERAILEAFR